MYIVCTDLWIYYMILVSLYMHMYRDRHKPVYTHTLPYMQTYMWMWGYVYMGLCMLCTYVCIHVQCMNICMYMHYDICLCITHYIFMHSFLHEYVLYYYICMHYDVGYVYMSMYYACMGVSMHVPVLSCTESSNRRWSVFGPVIHNFFHKSWGIWGHKSISFKA